ncbi:MAG: hypothetical protein MHM6MM_004483 [Cercozoa sp. M6MM]
MRLPTGTVVAETPAGPLSLQRVLGSGTFGVVYLACTMDGTAKSYALKMIEIDATSDESVVSAVLRESEIMGTLKHPNIVNFYGSFLYPPLHETADTLSSHLCILLELVEGGSLQAQLAQLPGRRLGEDTAKCLTKQLLLGLQYLHKKRVFHRDIKCGNILMSPEGVAKLADFGSSRFVSTASDRKTLAGTVQFMAPEVVRQSGSGLSSDIWSCGATVLEMLTVHRCESQHAVLFQICFTQRIPRLPSTVTPECRNFLRRCFVRNAAKRPTAEELLQHPWLADAQIPECLVQSLASQGSLESSSSHDSSHSETSSHWQKMEAAQRATEHAWMQRQQQAQAQPYAPATLHHPPVHAIAPGQTPLMQTPLMQTPLMRTPLMRTPLMQTPLMQTPSQTPLLPTPAFGYTPPQPHMQIQTTVRPISSVSATEALDAVLLQRLSGQRVSNAQRAQLFSLWQGLDVLVSQSDGSKVRDRLRLSTQLLLQLDTGRLHTDTSCLRVCPATLSLGAFAPDKTLLLCDLVPLSDTPRRGQGVTVLVEFASSTERQKALLAARTCSSLRS